MKSNSSIHWNDESDSHYETISKLLRQTGRFDCAVAFAKWSGFKLLEETLVASLKKGLKARFIIGLDFYQSEPAVLKKLLGLKKRFGVEAYIKETGGDVFHPKVYRFQNATGVVIVIGSANLTNGGMRGNYEISAKLVAPNDTKIKKHFDELISNQDVIELCNTNYKSYRDRYFAYHVLQNLSELQIEKVLNKKKAGLEALAEVLRQMKAGSKHSEFSRQVLIRKKSRRQARIILDKIGNAKSMSPAKLLSWYEELGGQLWQSGGLLRNKRSVVKSPAAFQQIVQLAASSGRKSPKSTFDAMRECAIDIIGVGPNILTEILQGYNNLNFAVMNQNSVAGMKLAGFSEFPDRPAKSQIDGEAYALFCEKAKLVQQSLGLANLSELDALFNYAYPR